MVGKGFKRRVGCLRSEYKGSSGFDYGGEDFGFYFKK